MEKSKRNQYLAAIATILICLGVSASVTAAKATAAERLETPQGVSVTRKSDKSQKVNANNLKDTGAIILGSAKQTKSNGSLPN